MFEKIVVCIKDVVLKKLPEKKHVKINKHPYYLSLLKKDKNMFEKYISYSKYQSGKPSGNWKVFKSIYNNIKKNGIDYSNEDKIKIIHKYGKIICIQGRHRICILQKIHGEI